MIVKMSRRTPAPPRGGTSLCWPLTTTATKNGGKNPFTTTSFTDILIHCIGLSNVVLVLELQKNTWTGMWHHFYHVWLCTKFTHQVTHNTDPRTSFGTPKTTFTHFNQTTLCPQSVSVSSDPRPEKHLQHAITVSKLRSGFWKLVTPLPCPLFAPQCRWFYRTCTLTLVPRVVFWSAHPVLSPNLKRRINVSVKWKWVDQDIRPWVLNVIEDKWNDCGKWCGLTWRYNTSVLSCWYLQMSVELHWKWPMTRRRRKRAWWRVWPKKLDRCARV